MSRRAGLVLAATLTLAATTSFVGPGLSPAVGEAPAGLPPVPAGGELGFLVDRFTLPLIPGLEPCPDGLAPTVREAYVKQLDPVERERLLRAENEEELTRRWKAWTAGPGGANICTNPDMFPDRPLIPTVRHPLAWGMDLDGGKTEDGCAHEEFTDPRGQTGIDNQEYRVMGCWPTFRGTDGNGGEVQQGYRQFFSSGEWTQVLIIRGIDSLVRDDDVTVIYANTPDRPVADSTGRFLAGASFTISDAPPRNRNVLKARIVNGVLETEPQDIVLTQTWGQGGARDIRGNRTKFTFHKGRLRLTFNPDGTVSGMLGGYRPLFEIIQSPALGGSGSATVAGIDCASQLATLRKMADGIRDPQTGQCTAVSSAVQIGAIPAFVNDVPVARQGRATR
ncbi:MAG TPA: hypothetical protein PKD92_06585 [Novosphingobium sp.]|nr:hypothetical protein [Novosphingobium sp.]